MQIESIRPFLAVAVSLLGAALIVLTRKSPNIREGCSVVAAALKFLIIFSMIPIILAGNTLHYTLFSIAPGISISFQADAMGLFFAVIASFLWILTTFYSIGYMRSLKEHAQTRYYLCFALTLSATIGVAFADNLLTLYIAYELVGLFAYPLVVHDETKEAFAKGNKYLFYLFWMAKLFLFAAFLSYALSGTLGFNPNGIFPADADPTLLTITFFLFVVGIGAKAAIMPLHLWLPAAMIAPTPVSALLHAVAVVKVGVFAILKIVLFVFGVDLLSKLGIGIILGYLACFTTIAASFVALKEDNLKSRLAYSTISQLSYIILGVALLSTSAITGAIMHIVAHAFGKITLFFAAGAIFVAANKKKISELDGIGKQMPFTMTAFTIAALSMIGLPPAIGFLSKWYLFLGSIEADQMLFFVVLASSAILNAFYFLPIVYAAFFKELPPGEKAERREAPAFMVVPLTLTAIGTVIILFFPSFFLDLARMVAASTTG